MTVLGSMSGRTPGRFAYSADPVFHRRSGFGEGGYRDDCSSRDVRARVRLPPGSRQCARPSVRSVAGRSSCPCYLVVAAAVLAVGDGSSRVQSVRPQSDRHDRDDKRPDEIAVAPVRRRRPAGPDCSEPEGGSESTGVLGALVFSSAIPGCLPSRWGKRRDERACQQGRWRPQSSQTRYGLESTGTTRGMQRLGRQKCSRLRHRRRGGTGRRQYKICSGPWMLVATSKSTSHDRVGWVTASGYADGKRRSCALAIDV
jgi:hypothetical protein